MCAFITARPIGSSPQMVRLEEAIQMVQQILPQEASVFVADFDAGARKTV